MDSEMRASNKTTVDNLHYSRVGPTTGYRRMYNNGSGRVR